LGKGFVGYSSSKPIAIQGLKNDSASVRIGIRFVCSVSQNGAAECWGDNYNGSLGNGSTNNSILPVGVNGLSQNVLDLAAGYASACALLSSGNIKCWGKNTQGELGIGNSDSQKEEPVNVIGFGGVITPTSTPTLGIQLSAPADGIQRITAETANGLEFSFIPPKGWEYMIPPGETLGWWRKKCGNLYCILAFADYPGTTPQNADDVGTVILSEIPENAAVLSSEELVFGSDVITYKVVIGISDEYLSRYTSYVFITKNGLVLRVDFVHSGLSDYTQLDMAVEDSMKTLEIVQQ
jgi:hypothetical protein